MSKKINQILQTNLNNNYSNKKKLKFILKIQLYFSIVLIIIVGTILIKNSINLYKQEKYSNQILDNYNITKIYSNLYLNKSSNTDENIQETYVIGIIEIPNINVYYPIFSNCNEDLLKISPCRLYGPLPGKYRKFMYCWS